MRILNTLTVALVLIFGLVASPSGADAKGVAVWSTGEDVFEAGELPEELKSPESEGWSAGYKCSIFGVFWAYVHWWDCEPVIYKGDAYNNSPEVAKAVAAKYSQDDMKMGVWQGYGRWSFALLVLFAIGGMFVRGGDDEDEDA